MTQPAAKRARHCPPDSHHQALLDLYNGDLPSAFTPNSVALLEVEPDPLLPLFTDGYERVPGSGPNILLSVDPQDLCIHTYNVKSRYGAMAAQRWIKETLKLRNIGLLRWKRVALAIIPTEFINPDVRMGSLAHRLLLSSEERYSRLVPVPTKVRSSTVDGMWDLVKSACQSQPQPHTPMPEFATVNDYPTPRMVSGDTFKYLRLRAVPYTTPSEPLPLTLTVSIPYTGMLPMAAEHVFEIINLESRYTEYDVYLDFSKCGNTLADQMVPSLAHNHNRMQSLRIEVRWSSIAPHPEPQWVIVQGEITMEAISNDLLIPSLSASSQ